MNRNEIYLIHEDTYINHIKPGVFGGDCRVFQNGGSL